MKGRIDLAMIKLLRSLTTAPEGCSHSDWVNLQVFAAALFLPVLIMYVGVLMHGGGQIMNTLIYMVALAVFGYVGLRELNSADVLVLLCIYAFFVLNFLIDPSLSEYYVDPKMIVIYLLYIPVGVCVVRKIKDWDYFFDVCRIYCLFALFVALTTVFVYDSAVLMNYEFFSYMPYSYFILPYILCSYVLARRKKSLLWLAVSLTLFASVLSYGARNAVMMTPLFVCAYELFTGSVTKRLVILLVILVLGVALYFFIDKIMYSLSLIPFLENSRLITKFLSKAVTSGGERDLFINEGIRRLLHMEMEIPGLFGDRKYISGPYPHNIMLEIMLQFGWILGIVFNAFLFYLVCYSVFLSRNKVMGIFLFFGIFGKLFVSDTYVMYGNFWLWMFASISLCNSSFAKTVRYKPRMAGLTGFFTPSERSNENSALSD